MTDRSTHTPFRFPDLDALRAAIDELRLDLSVEEDVSPLLQSRKVGGGTIPNSIAIQPMEGCDGTPEGAPGELTLRRYRRFAAGGAGLLWFEATAVVPEGRANPRQLWLNVETKDSFARLLDDARTAARETMGEAHRPFAVLQLTHSGRYSRPGREPSPVIAAHDPILDAAHGIPPDQPVISDEELERLEDIYVEAAGIAFEAGFDAVDIKACHRYLVNELLAAHTRDGKYGGSYENRTRFLKNVIGKVFDRLGRDKVVTCRLGIYDGHPYPYGWGVDRTEDAGPNLEEPKRLLRELHEMGVPLVNITMGNPYYAPHVNRPFDRPTEGGEYPEEHPLAGVERLVRLTREVREGLPGLTVVGSGYSWLRNLWPNVAAAEMRIESIQIVGVGRQAYAYPDFARELIETGRLDRRHTCISCSACTQIMRDGGMAGCVPFDSVIYGPIYREGRRGSLDYLRAQASRCRDCFDPLCRDGCPAGVEVPGFIRALADGDIRRSYEILRERNVLPEVCACVCPAQAQCEGKCIEGIYSGNPVPIAEIQHYVSRTAREKGWTSLPKPERTAGKSIAVVGAGAAGLACAAELLRRGNTVHLYDSCDQTGGIAGSAIPVTRLRLGEFDAEIEGILGQLRGERLIFHSGCGLGEDRSLDDLAREYDAVFLGIGLAGSQTLTDHRPPGVLDAISFLRECKKGQATVPDRVAVLGGGNTAVDAATQAILCGARDVYLIYRRSFAEMPAWKTERDEALNLGVQFMLLTQPLGYEVDAHGRLRGVWIARTTLGEPDASGRRRPVMTQGRESLLEVELALEALGQRLPGSMEALLGGVRLTEDRLIEVDECGRTSRRGVYAGGDIVNGGMTVVQAVAEGMRAARAIHEDLTDSRGDPH